MKPGAITLVRTADEARTHRGAGGYKSRQSWTFMKIYCGLLRRRASPPSLPKASLGEMAHALRARGVWEGASLGETRVLL
ncbi:MAG: hypothetical protein ACLR4Z_08755 [Butyricicoccaceae bacterium]